MSVKFNRFDSQMRGADKIAEDCWKATSAKRITIIVPNGCRVYDTDIGMVFIGDGSTYGGRSAVAKREVKTITAAAASAFTSNDTFKTIASAASGVFTSTAHGFAVGSKVIGMTATNATYALTQYTVYTVATVPTANTFTLTDVTPGDQTANYVVKVYDIALNDYLTWAGSATMRTGDAVTTAAGSGTLPTGLSATKYYIVKNDTSSNGGFDRNTTTSIKLATSRANALAGTVVTIRTAGAVGFTMVATEVYATKYCDVAVTAAAVAIDNYLPDATTVIGKTYSINNSGAASVTVKSLGTSTVGGVAAGTGLVLKAASNDFVTVVSDGTNWIVIGKQITA